jgi:hypothetical protein
MTGTDAHTGGEIDVPELTDWHGELRALRDLVDRLIHAYGPTAVIKVDAGWGPGEGGTRNNVCFYVERRKP